MDSQQLVSQAAPPLLRLSPPAEHDPSSSQQIHRSGDAGNGDTPVAHPVRSEQRRSDTNIAGKTKSPRKTRTIETNPK